MNSRHLLALSVSLALCSNCSGGEAQGDEASAAATQPVAEETASSARSTGDVDQELADRGQSLFQSKGCVGCHTVGNGRLTGPDLKGVTQRREFNWIVSMMMNPDSMVKDDPVARQLLTEYMTPMLNMGVSPDEAKAIYEYLRRASQ
jgi:cytochrome c